MFFETHKTEFITTGFILLFLLIIRFVINMLIKKISQKKGINMARIHLMQRYVTFMLFLLALVIIPFVFGIRMADFVLVFSSVFAVLGIALFAIWSILSNITSGVIMFFSFPYKVGDKIQILDKDFPIEAIIEDIRAFQLILRLDNGNIVTYPNNLMLQKAVTLVQKDAIETFYDDGTDLI